MKHRGRAGAFSVPPESDSSAIGGLVCYFPGLMLSVYLFHDHYPGCYQEFRSLDQDCPGVPALKIADITVVSPIVRTPFAGCDHA